LEPEGILISIFRYLYKKRQARTLESKKPMIKWLPKYTVAIKLKKELASNFNSHEALGNMLVNFGFTFKYATKSELYFTRGKSWGDFSIKWIRINLIFDLPLGEETSMRIEMADMCFFDTGDLWSLSTELSNYFSEQAQLNQLEVD